MANVFFKKGLLANLPASYAAGTFYVTTDERAMYLDIDDSTRIRLGDFIQVDAVANLPTEGASTTALYYCVAENILAKWNGATWTQINKQPTAEEMKALLGLGSLAYLSEVAEANLNADLATKINAAATKTELNDVDAKFANYRTSADQDVIDNDHANRIKTLEDKFTGEGSVEDKIAEAVAAEKERAEGIESGLRTDVDAIKGDYLKSVDKTELEGKITAVDNKLANYNTTEAQKVIDDAQDAAIKAIADDYVKAADIANFETKENVKKVADDLAAYVTSNDAAVALKADKSVVDAMYTNDQIDTAVQGAKDYAKGLVDALPEQTDYTVTITETTDGLDTGIAKKYTFTQNGAEIGSINLAKELVVTSGSVKEVTIADMPYAGAVVGDKYIELVIANQDAPIYVPAKDLVDIYTAKDGAAEVQVAISNTNEISATLVNGGVTEEKLAESVKTKLNKVWEEVGVAKGLVDAEKERADAAYDTKGAAADAQAAAEATAAAALATARTEISAEIDADVKVVADDLAGYKTSNDAALALKANTADVYAKTETYNKEEIDAAIEAAKTDAANKDAVILSEAQKYTDTAKAEAIADAEGKVNALAGNVYTKAEVDALLTWGEF